MNAAVITDDVVSMLRKRYGKPTQHSKAQVFTFGSSATFSINYSRLLRGEKFFYAVPSAMADAGTAFPETELGEFALFICGSADKVLVIPRAVICEMLQAVPTRRVDIFKDGNSLILQTTKHPKLDVSEFLGALPVPKKALKKTDEGPDENRKTDRIHVKVQWSLIRLGRAEGCSVWVPINDRNLSCEGAPFSGNTLERLPNFGFEEGTRRIVQNIDVLWLKKNVIVKAFEIESTTAIYSGLLRLNDLASRNPTTRSSSSSPQANEGSPRCTTNFFAPHFTPCYSHADLWRSSPSASKWCDWHRSDPPRACVFPVWSRASRSRCRVTSPRWRILIDLQPSRGFTRVLDHSTRWARVSVLFVGS